MKNEKNNTASTFESRFKRAMCQKEELCRKEEGLITLQKTVIDFREDIKNQSIQLSQGSKELYRQYKLSIKPKKIPVAVFLGRCGGFDPSMGYDHYTSHVKNALDSMYDNGMSVKRLYRTVFPNEKLNKNKLENIFAKRGMKLSLINLKNFKDKFYHGDNLSQFKKEYQKDIENAVSEIGKFEGTLITSVGTENGHYDGQFLTVVAGELCKKYNKIVELVNNGEWQHNSVQKQILAPIGGFFLDNHDDGNERFWEGCSTIEDIVIDYARFKRKNNK